MSHDPQDQPELATERLRLRRFTPDDAEFALELHANPDLVRFLPHATLTTLAEARAWIERTRLVENPKRPLFGWWLVELADGTPVATVVLKPIPASAGYTQEDVEIGWRQHADHTGRGYVTEAAALLLDRAVAAGLPRVVAVTDPDNVASQRVCARLRMEPRGLTDAYYDQRTSLFVRDAARTYRWRSLVDPTQTDDADVTFTDDGLRARGRQRTDTYIARWRLDASRGWVTRTLDVEVEGAGWSRALRLTRDPDTGTWTATTTQTGAAPPDLADPGLGDDVDLTTALDCDLGRCPLTNTMPIRRLGLLAGDVPMTPLVMAWVEMPSLRVIASDQYYGSAGSGRVHYVSGARAVDVTLTVDEAGVVTHYPDLADLDSQSSGS